MTLRERLEAMPPGALVPVSWLLEQLHPETGEASPPALEVDLTVDELAVLFGKQPSTIRGWLEAGRFPGAYKLGRAWRAPRAAVSAFQEAARHPAPAEAPRRTPADLGAWRGVSRRV